MDDGAEFLFRAIVYLIWGLVECLASPFTFTYGMSGKEAEGWMKFIAALLILMGILWGVSMVI